MVKSSEPNEKSVSFGVVISVVILLPGNLPEALPNSLTDVESFAPLLAVHVFPDSSVNVVDSSAPLKCNSTFV
jgi:hypothetical protein